MQLLLAVQAAGGMGWLSVAPLIFIFAIFYFLLILPQQRRQKKWTAMLDSLKTGDKVTTSGGLRGTIMAIKDDSIHLRVPPNNLVVEVTKASVTQVTTEEETTKSKSSGHSLICEFRFFMNKNLLWKLITILAAMLVCLYGIFGVPQSFSGDGLLTAMTNRIHLGLDLRGGTHLILQVQVNDAVNIDSDNAVEVLKEQLNKRKIAFADISKPDPQGSPDKVVLKGVPTEGRKDLLDIVTERLPEYNLSPGAENTYTLTMKPQTLSDLKTKAVSQAIETIRNRIEDRKSTRLN